MATIDEGLQVGSTNEYILAMIKLLLLFFALGIVCRCLMVLLKGLAEGKEIGEMVKVIQNRILAAVLAGCASGVIEVIERAFE